jgi:hypothetical protein
MYPLFLVVTPWVSFAHEPKRWLEPSSTTTTANPQSCSSATVDIQAFLGITEAVQALDEWLQDTTSTTTTLDTGICTVDSSAKTTCLLDYAEGSNNATELVSALQETCTNVGGIFIQTDYVFECTSPDEPDRNIFYTSNGKPSCYASNCESSEMEGMEDEMTSQAMAQLESKFNVVCSRVRLIVSDPIYPPTLPPAQQPIDSAADPFTPPSCVDASLELMTVVWNDSIFPEPVDAAVWNVVEPTCETATNGTELCVADFSLVPANVSSTVPGNVTTGSIAQQMQNTCTATSDGVSAQMKYNLLCTATVENNTIVTRIISVTADPLCASKTFCTSQDIDEELAVQHAQRIFFDPNSTTTNSPTPMTRPSNSSSWSCTVSNLVVQTLGVTYAPTTSPSPTTSFLPPSGPTAATPAPTTAACMDQSLAWNQTNQGWHTRFEAVAVTIVPDLAVLDNEIELPDGSTTHLYSCSADPTSSTPSRNTTINLRRRQRDRQLQVSSNAQNSCQVSLYESNKTATTPRQVCQQAGGTYAEVILDLRCTSKDTGVVIQQTLVNQPTCLATNCNQLESQEVVFELNRWRLEAMRQAHPEMKCDFVEPFRLLAGVGNVDGYAWDQSLPSTVSLSDDCRDESDFMSTVISIYNEKTVIRKIFEKYVDVDPRELCFSPIPGRLGCDFDWSEFAAQTPTVGGLEGLCEANYGQFITSSVETTCYSEEDALTLFIHSNNVPNCVGWSCTAGQAERFLTTAPLVDLAMIESPYIDLGFNCSSSIANVFTPLLVSLDKRPSRPPTDPPKNAPPTLSPTILTLVNDTSDGNDGVEDETDGNNNVPESNVSTLSEEPSKSGLPVGVLVGSLVAGLFCVGLLMAWWVRKRRRAATAKRAVDKVEGEDSATRGSDEEQGGGRASGEGQFLDEYMENAMAILDNDEDPLLAPGDEPFVGVYEDEDDSDMEFSAENVEGVDVSSDHTEEGEDESENEDDGDDSSSSEDPEVSDDDETDDIQESKI